MKEFIKLSKDELVELLKNDVKAFNQYRIDSCFERLDLRYANLSDADLRYANLSDADLRSANLRSANLSDADLKSANLRYANLRYADLRSANLSDADLDYSCLPLWCGGQFKADEKICKQLVAHVVKIMENSEEGGEEMIKMMNDYKSGWHREDEF